MGLERRISRDLTDLGSDYSVVVIGSGYGAGVAASRLARTGQRVCVLERGREIRPGDYPDAITKATDSMQIDTSRGKIGDADALFNLHVNDDMFALVGCGLGGTSLINANVGLMMDARLHQLEHWPAVYRDNPDLLAPFAKRAAEMLSLSPYPESWPKLNKLEALRKSAAVMGQPFAVPPIAVNFEDQTNPFGVPQPACTNCGDCCSGCNVGAKNTTLMNYLPDAANHGTEIYTRARVDYLVREGDRWRVFVVPNGKDAPGKPTSVLADIVVVGAGALGSTEILLRSAARGLPLSPTLGTRFSGNGDVLAFGYDSYWTDDKAADGTPTPQNINGIGVGSNDVPKAQYPGPCITGVIDMRNAADPKDGLVIEEGVVPGILAAAMPAGYFFGQAIAGSFTQFGFDEVKPRLLDAKAMGETFQTDPGSLAGWAYHGPVARSQTYLTMSVDDAGGRLALENDRLRIIWPGVGSQPSIVRDNALIRQASDAVKGQFFPNPIWTGPLGRKLITVHPVGGCGMADDAAKGVVNDRCQVFAGASGTAVHPGLYVMDGSVMPGAVGVNPLLTISAVAERAAELLARDRGWQIDWTMKPKAALPPVPAKTAPAPQPAPGHHGLMADIGDFFHKLGDSHGGLVAKIKQLIAALEDDAIDVFKSILKEILHDHPDLLSPEFGFTETMHGWVSTRDMQMDTPESARVTDSYAVAAAWGQSAGTKLDFKLTIHSDNLNEMVTDQLHRAKITGEVHCPTLSTKPMSVREGEFRLLPIDQEQVETWTMNYAMLLDRAEGPCRFEGHKILKQRAGSNLWTDVTTLYVKIRDGADGKGPLLAQGIITLDIEDLVWQAKSVTLDLQSNIPSQLIGRISKARTAIAIVYLAKLASLFGLSAFRAYGGLLADMNNFPAADLAANPPLRPRRALRAPAPEPVFLDLEGGFRVKLTRYRGGAKGPVIVAPGYSIKASSFAIDTVEENLVEALVKAGYDTWLFDYRASPDSGTPHDADHRFTVDDIAQGDWPAAIDHVKAVTGAPSVQALAHCVGSMSLLMGIAAGKTSVRSMIASQLTLHPVTNWLSYLKADLNAAGLVAGLDLLHGSFDFRSGTSDLDHEIDAAAWQLPVPPGQECKNPVCRRIFGVYGPSYDHAQLNHWTHQIMTEMVGEILLTPLIHLQDIMRAGHVIDADGKNSYLTQAGAKNLAIPISFIPAANNQFFYPESSQRTRAWLSGHNDPSLYRQTLIPGYAHMDLFIGKNAAHDIFPALIADLDRFN